MQTYGHGPIHGRKFQAVVDDIVSGKTTGDQLYQIRYEDGDTESMTQEQLVECIELFEAQTAEDN